MRRTSAPPSPPTPSSSPPLEEPLTGEAGAGGRALAAHSQRPLRRRSALSPLPSHRHKSPQRGAACKTRSGAGDRRGAASWLPLPGLPSAARGRTSWGGGRYPVPPRLPPPRPPPTPRAPPQPSPHGPRAPLAPRRGSRARGPPSRGEQRAPRGRPTPPRPGGFFEAMASPNFVGGELRRRPRLASRPRSKGSERGTHDQRKLSKWEL